MSIYLDNAATTFPKPDEMYDFMNEFYSKYGVNPGRGSYSMSEKCSELIDETRILIAKKLSYNNVNNIVFTPSATISINTIIGGINLNKSDSVYITPFEHNAVVRALNNLKNTIGINIREIPFKKDPISLDVKKLKVMFQHEPPKLVCCSEVSNVLGYILPIDEITTLAKQKKAIILIDAAQSAGSFKMNYKNIDFYVFSGHKSLYGPSGIAGFIYNSSIKLTPLYYGGTGNKSERPNMPEEIPMKYEAGSPNILGIAGLNASIKWLLKKENKEMLDIRKTKLDKLRKMVQKFSDVSILDVEDENNYGTINIIPKQGLSIDYATKLEKEYGYMCRGGYHCAPLTHKFLGTLNGNSQGTVRLSVGITDL